MKKALLKKLGKVEIAVASWHSRRVRERMPVITYEEAALIYYRMQEEIRAAPSDPRLEGMSCDELMREYRRAIKGKGP